MKVLIAANWKMNKKIEEGIAFVNELKKNLENRPNRGVLLCVPFTMLNAISEAAKGSSIMVGSEDMFYEDEGAFTGAISPIMIKDAGATFTLVGHSERRMIFGETDEIVNKKIKKALSHNISPILCIGENLEERESNKLESVLTNQLKGALEGLTSQELKDVIIAYEPIWAIGTGKTASPQDADDSHAIIRVIVANMYGGDIADNILILYGGSVKVDNINDLIVMPNINGALIGGASLDVDSFIGILKHKCGCDSNCQY